MIRIENICKSYGPKILLEGASFHFPEGEKIALIGENGTGKSTLLNILTGVESQDAGKVLIPGRARPGFLPQEPNPDPCATVLEECETGAVALAALRNKLQHLVHVMETDSSDKTISLYEKTESAFKNAGGYELSSRAASILAGLGFSEEKLTTDPRSLSGGWRMRLELGRIFMNDPDFLILDEPTNHLDLPSLVWVESWLKTFRGTLLFVSHDKALLNRLSTVTLHLHAGTLTPYRGNFDAFLEARALRAEQEEAEREGLRARKEDLERFVQRFGAKATKAKQAKSKMKMIEKLNEQEKAIPVQEQESSLTFRLPEPEKSDRIIFSIEKGSIGYNAPLSTGIQLQIEKSHKIAVIGANGIGKSTLLKTIVDKISPLGGSFTSSPRTRIAWFAQDQAETLNKEQDILSNVLNQTSMGEKDIRSLLGGFLFTGDDVFKRVKVLSGGEKSRVGLACILAKASNFLLLDEPTNHLDMKSISRLIQALQDYKGTIAFVSHDREFIDQVCTHIFAMLPDGRSMLFEGNLEDYARLSEIAGFPNVLLSNQESGESNAPARNPAEGNSVDDIPDFRELKKRYNRLTKSLKSLDQQIAGAKEKKAGLEKQMAATNPDDFEKLRKLQEESEELTEQINLWEESWLEAQEDLEDVLEMNKKSGRSLC